MIQRPRDKVEVCNGKQRSCAKRAKNRYSRVPGSLVRISMGMGAHRAYRYAESLARRRRNSRGLKIDHSRDKSSWQMLVNQVGGSLLLFAEACPTRETSRRFAMIIARPPSGELTILARWMIAVKAGRPFDEPRVEGSGEWIRFHLREPREGTRTTARG